MERTDDRDLTKYDVKLSGQRYELHFSYVFHGDEILLAAKEGAAIDGILHDISPVPHQTTIRQITPTAAPKTTK